MFQILVHTLGGSDRDMARSRLMGHRKLKKLHAVTQGVGGSTLVPRCPRMRRWRRH